MSGLSKVKKNELTPDQRFDAFISDWAKKQGLHFVVDTFDGRQPDSLIDGMEVDDVWGWLLSPNEEPNDGNFGCIEWNLDSGRLVLTWNTYG